MKNLNTISKIAFLGVIIWIVIIITVIVLISKEFDSTVTDSKNIDYAVILGAGLNRDQLSDRLKLRLDVAYNYLKDNDIPIVVSGGQGEDELVTEASAMKKYLIEQGISNDRILEEDKSTSTYENLLFSKKIMHLDAPNVLIITSDYHMYRAKRIGKRIGLNVQGLSATNSSKERVRLMKREILSVIKDIMM